jgi:anti-anti-sigma factor
MNTDATTAADRDGETVTVVDGPPAQDPPRFAMSLTTLPSGTRVVGVSGEVDIATADVFGDLLLAALDLDHPHVVVDAEHLEFCDAQGLRALTAAADLAEALGGRVTIVNARPLVVRLLRITGLCRRFAVRAAAAQPS